MLPPPPQAAAAGVCAGLSDRRAGAARPAGRRWLAASSAERGSAPDLLPSALVMKEDKGERKMGKNKRTVTEELDGTLKEWYVGKKKVCTMIYRYVSIF